MRALRSLRSVVVAAAATVILVGLGAAPASAATRISVTPAPVHSRRWPAQPAPPARAITWRVPIAMYHIVTPLAPDTTNTDLFVRTSEFDAQLKLAAAKGIRTITAHDMGASIAANVAIPAKTMVLSFDDGRLESIKYAWPIMQEYGSSLVFTGTKWIARDVNHDGRADPGYIGTFYVIVGRHNSDSLSFDQEATLAKAGNEIANHTNSHVDVRMYHGAALTAQVTTAGHTLETEMAKRGVTTTVTTFAYPYGYTSTEAVNLLTANGYTIAVSTVEGIAHSGQNLLLLPRVRVSRGQTAAKFVASLGY
jgi:peptidoglycan/xylan/chitin deacetylase (PgdA/CDA1 family)